MRYTGHMDLHRTLERTLRRAGLPLSHSKGFTRRAKLNLAAALPLGVTSAGELAEIWLDETLPLDEIQTRIETAAPPGLRLQHLEEIDLQQPKLPNRIHSGEYIVTLRQSPPDLAQRVLALLSAGTLPRRRRGKPYDLRPLILDLAAIEPDEQGFARLKMTLLAQEGATGRCDEVVSALEIDPATALVHRTALHLKS